MINPFNGRRLLKQFFLLLAIVLFSNLNGSAQNATTLSNWKYFSTVKNKWITATVPGAIQCDLMDHEIIDNPFNDPGYELSSKISSSSHNYQTIFSCTKQELLMENAFLDFQGIDTYAEVFLNGEKIFIADNMFRNWYIDVKYLLKQKNILNVHFLNLDSIESSKMKSLPYQLPEGARVFTRKAQYQYGWDFSAKVKTVGIWKPVTLLFHNGAFITDVFVNTISSTSALFMATAEVHLMASHDESLLLSFVIQENLLPFDSIVNVKKGNNTIRVPFSIANPQLWNVDGIGESLLYTLKVTAPFNATVFRKFGCREIILHQEKDSIGSSFYFTINGKRKFIKGSNIVPPDLFPSRVSDDVYERLVLQAKNANMNMLRIWGGGYYFPDSFYDYCDRYGIMIWQDFMFGCAMYPGDSAFMNTTKHEIMEQVNRLKSHPSMALFCGNNESDEGWKNWGWQDLFKYSSADSTTIANDYKKLFEVLIPQVIDSLAPAIFYYPSSPKNGWGRKQSLTEGDCHYWGVWWGFEPFANYNKKVGRFMSEFGFQGFPDLSFLKKYVSKCDTNDLSFRYHQQHIRGFETINTYMLRDYPVSDSFPDYAYVSQLMQADEIEITALNHRMHYPYCSGTLYWQLNDSWPSISWSSIDYALHPKLLYYRMKKAYAQQAMVCDTSNGKRLLNIHYEGSKRKPYLLRLSKCASNTNESSLNLETKVINLFPDSVQTFPILDFTPDKNKNIVYRFTLTELNDTISETDCYLFNSSPKELPLLNADVNLKIIGKQLLEVSSNRFTYGVYLYDDAHQCVFSNNGFHLFPGEKKIISITGNTALVKVKCLNNIARP